MRNEVVIQKLIGYNCNGKDYDNFIADTKLVEACIFNLSLMGELVNKLGGTFTTEHGEIPWRSIYGLRNILVHDLRNHCGGPSRIADAAIGVISTLIPKIFAKWKENKQQKLQFQPDWVNNSQARILV